MDVLSLFLVLLAALIIFSAFFSGCEAALFSLGRRQIKRLEDQPGAGGEVAGLLTHPRRLLITILIGNLIVNVFSTSVATSIAVSMLGDTGVVVAFVFMSVLILIFGEISPKALAIGRAERFAIVAAYPLKFFHIIFLPIRAPIASFTDAIIESLKKRLGVARRHFSQDELLTAVDIGRHEGGLGQFEHALLSNVIEFRQTVVKEIMTPSIDVISFPIDTTTEEMLEKTVRTEFSRFPVYGDTADDIRGIVHIKDLATLVHQAPGGDVASILRAPYYVPESSRIAGLFERLAAQKSQLAVVIDEYGSYVGIVTMEDILEELVGEIRDANEPRTSEFSLLDDGRIVILGSMNIDDFNRVFDTRVVDDFHETMAGYVLGATGSIPNEGETIDIDDLRFHIISAQPNRIRKMRVEKL